MIANVDKLIIKQESLAAYHRLVEGEGPDGVLLTYDGVDYLWLTDMPRKNQVFEKLVIDAAHRQGYFYERKAFDYLVLATTHEGESLLDIWIEKLPDDNDENLIKLTLKKG